jgi:hypothetical protein
MLWESKEVKSSLGGLPEYRSVMCFLEGKTLDFSEETGYESGRFRKHSEIADMVEREFSAGVIDACKNVYELEAQGK